MVERWKETPLPNIEVSDEGRVRNTKTGRVLKGSPVRGYIRIAVGKRRHRVHRLVLAAFVEPPSPEHRLCNHKNLIKDDNRLSNLEWATHSGNTQHAYDSGCSRPVGSERPNSKLTEELVLEMRERYSGGNGTIRHLADVFGVSPKTVWQVVNRESWRHC